MKPPARTGLWPVRCAPIGSVAVGSVLWRHGGELHCTAVVKATFGLEPRGPMRRINPSPIRRSDDYLHGVPSLAGASEVAPRMDQVDVTIVGHAYARPPTTKRAVRFVVVRGHTVLIDKTLYVYGDRGKGESPRPFERMRIGYERALGGLDFPRNPIGVGADTDATTRPNIVHPKGPKKKVAGYGPIPARFLQRRQLRGKVPLERMADGIAEYPEGFDWSYFQAAPRDQRLDRLKGDEWLMLEGMHPEHDRIRARLPHARALCRVYAAKPVGAPEAVEMTPTMLHLEPDDDRCSVVWRGTFVVVSELAAQQLIVAGAVQCGDEPVRWPAGFEAVDAVASPAAPISEIEGSQADDFQRTVVSPGAREHQPARALGGGYRLGEQKIQLAAAPPASPAEPAPHEALDAHGNLAADRAAQWAAHAPPPVPPPRVPPPPSFPARDSGQMPAVRGGSASGGYGSAARPPAPYPPAPSALSEAELAPSDLGPPRPAAARSPFREAPSANPRDVQAVPIDSAVAAEASPDLSSTDELEDPDADAAADAGIAAPSQAAATQRAEQSPFESTQLIEEPEADALEDVSDDPFAFTQVHVDVDDD